MANRRITDHTALLGNAVSASDLIHLVDVSDATDAASGTNKKMLLSQFGGRFLIQEQTVSAVSSISFASIPQMFNRLILKARLTSSQASDSTGCSIYFNGDTTDANYFTEWSSDYNVNTVVGEDANAKILNVTGASGVGSSVNTVELEGYASSAIKHAIGYNMLYRQLNASSQMLNKSTFHDTMTAALTSFSIVPDTGTLSGVLRLYGEF